VALCVCRSHEPEFIESSGFGVGARACAGSHVLRVGVATVRVMASDGHGTRQPCTSAAKAFMASWPGCALRVLRVGGHSPVASTRDFQTLRFEVFVRGPVLNERLPLPCAPYRQCCGSITKHLRSRHHANRLQIAYNH